MKALHEWVSGIDWSSMGGWLKRLADPKLLPIAIAVGIVLAALVVSLLAMVRATHMDHALREQAKELGKEFAGALEQMRARVDAFGEQLEDLRRTVSQIPNAPRAGLNMSKRSEALRMYRRGEPPDRIAAALDIARQEVDLLLKVHRIVIKNL
jgi:hypothetical protein